MALLLAVAAFAQSSFLTVGDITVLGANRVSADEILARSGLQRGQRLAAIDPRDVAAHLVQHPWIAVARVSVSLTGRVLLVIQERVAHAALPCAIWCAARSLSRAYVLVDHTGVALTVVHAAPAVPLITVDGATLPWVRLGDRVPSEAVDRALRVLAVMPQAEIARGLRLRIDRGGATTVTTGDRITVLLGRPPGLGARAAMLPPVLAAVRRQRMPVRLVDLRFTGSVILKPALTPVRGGVHP